MKITELSTRELWRSLRATEKSLGPDSASVLALRRELARRSRPLAGKTDEKPKTRGHPPFERGNPGGPGRPKGSVGIRMELREMFLQALDEAGGVKYLKGVAKKRPAPFVAAVAKMLPQSLKVDATFKPVWPELQGTDAESYLMAHLSGLLHDQHFFPVNSGDEKLSGKEAPPLTGPPAIPAG